MSIALATVTYRERRLLKAFLRNWKGKVDRILVLESIRPWYGRQRAFDGTKELCDEFGVEYSEGLWKTEQDQRNAGNAHLRDHDYVIWLDPDELMTEADQETLLERLEGHVAYKAKRLVTYWRDLDHVIDPPDYYEPLIVCKPSLDFVDCRCPARGVPQELLPVCIHHLKFVRSNSDMKKKLTTFMHAKQIRQDWYDRVWIGRKEDPTIDLYDHTIRSYKKQPAPDEIKDLFKRKGAP